MSSRLLHLRPPPPDELPPENPPLDPENDDPLLPDEDGIEALCAYDINGLAIDVDIIPYDENPPKDSPKLSFKLFLQ